MHSALAHACPLTHAVTAPRSHLLQRSLYFPNITGSRLCNKGVASTADMLYGKVSIVCILTSVLSEVSRTGKRIRSLGPILSVSDCTATRQELL